MWPQQPSAKRGRDGDTAVSPQKPSEVIAKAVPHEHTHTTQWISRETTPACGWASSQEHAIWPLEHCPELLDTDAPLVHTALGVRCGHGRATLVVRLALPRTAQSTSGYEDGFPVLRQAVADDACLRLKRLLVDSLRRAESSDTPFVAPTLDVRLVDRVLRDGMATFLVSALNARLVSSLATHFTTPAFNEYIAAARAYRMLCRVAHEIHVEVDHAPAPAAGGSDAGAAPKRARHAAWSPADLDIDPGLDPGSGSGSGSDAVAGEGEDLKAASKRLLHVEVPSPSVLAREVSTGGVLGGPFLTPLVGLTPKATSRARTPLDASIDTPRSGASVLSRAMSPAESIQFITDATRAMRLHSSASPPSLRGSHTPSRARANRPFVLPSAEFSPVVDSVYHRRPFLRAVCEGHVIDDHEGPPMALLARADAVPGVASPADVLRRIEDLRRTLHGDTWAAPRALADVIRDAELLQFVLTLPVQDTVLVSVHALQKSLSLPEEHPLFSSTEEQCVSVIDALHARGAGAVVGQELTRGCTTVPFMAVAKQVPMRPVRQRGPYVIVALYTSTSMPIVTSLAADVDMFPTEPLHVLSPGHTPSRSAPSSVGAPWFGGVSTTLQHIALDPHVVTRYLPSPPVLHAMQHALDNLPGRQLQYTISRSSVATAEDIARAWRVMTRAYQRYLSFPTFPSPRGSIQWAAAGPSGGAGAGAGAGAGTGSTSTPAPIVSDAWVAPCEALASCRDAPALRHALRRAHAMRNHWRFDDVRLPAAAIRQVLLQCPRPPADAPVLVSLVNLGSSPAHVTATLPATTAPTCIIEICDCLLSGSMPPASWSQHLALDIRCSIQAATRAASVFNADTAKALSVLTAHQCRLFMTNTEPCLGSVLHVLYAKRAVADAVAQVWEEQVAALSKTLEPCLARLQRCAIGKRAGETFSVASPSAALWRTFRALRGRLETVATTHTAARPRDGGQSSPCWSMVDDAALDQDARRVHVPVVGADGRRVAVQVDTQLGVAWDGVRPRVFHPFGTEIPMDVMFQTVVLVDMQCGAWARASAQAATRHSGGARRVRPVERRPAWSKAVAAAKTGRAAPFSVDVTLDWRLFMAKQPLQREFERTQQMMALDIDVSLARGSSHKEHGRRVDTQAQLEKLRKEHKKEEEMEDMAHAMGVTTVPVLLVTQSVEKLEAQFRAFQGHLVGVTGGVAVSPTDRASRMREHYVSTNILLALQELHEQYRAVGKGLHDLCAQSAEVEAIVHKDSAPLTLFSHTYDRFYVKALVDRLGSFHDALTKLDAALVVMGSALSMVLGSMDTETSDAGHAPNRAYFVTLVRAVAVWDDACFAATGAHYVDMSPWVEHLGARQSAHARADSGDATGPTGPTAFGASRAAQSELPSLDIAFSARTDPMSTATIQTRVRTCRRNTQEVHKTLEELHTAFQAFHAAVVATQTSVLAKRDAANLPVLVIPSSEQDNTLPYVLLVLATWAISCHHFGQPKDLKRAFSFFASQYCVSRTCHAAHPRLRATKAPTPEGLWYEACHLLPGGANLADAVAESLAVVAAKRAKAWKEANTQGLTAQKNNALQTLDDAEAVLRRREALEFRTNANIAAQHVLRRMIHCVHLEASTEPDGLDAVASERVRTWAIASSVHQRSVLEARIAKALSKRDSGTGEHAADAATMAAHTLPSDADANARYRAWASTPQTQRPVREWLAHGSNRELFVQRLRNVLCPGFSLPKSTISVFPESLQALDLLDGASHVLRLSHAVIKDHAPLPADMLGPTTMSAAVSMTPNLCMCPACGDPPAASACAFRHEFMTLTARQFADCPAMAEMQTPFRERMLVVWARRSVDTTDTEPGAAVSCPRATMWSAPPPEAPVEVASPPKDLKPLVVEQAPLDSRATALSAPESELGDHLNAIGVDVDADTTFVGALEHLRGVYRMHRPRTLADLQTALSRTQALSPSTRRFSLHLDISSVRASAMLLLRAYESFVWTCLKQPLAALVLDRSAAPNTQFASSDMVKALATLLRRSVWTNVLSVADAEVCSHFMASYFSCVRHASWTVFSRMLHARTSRLRPAHRSTLLAWAVPWCGTDAPPIRARVTSVEEQCVHTTVGTLSWKAWWDGVHSGLLSAQARTDALRPRLFLTCAAWADAGRVDTFVFRCLAHQLRLRSYTMLVHVASRTFTGVRVLRPLYPVRTITRALHLSAMQTRALFVQNAAATPCATFLSPALLFRSGGGWMLPASSHRATGPICAAAVFWPPVATAASALLLTDVMTGQRDPVVLSHVLAAVEVSHAILLVWLRATSTTPSALLVVQRGSLCRVALHGFLPDEPATRAAEAATTSIDTAATVWVRAPGRGNRALHPMVAAGIRMASALVPGEDARPPRVLDAPVRHARPQEHEPSTSSWRAVGRAAHPGLMALGEALPGHRFSAAVTLRGL